MFAVLFLPSVEFMNEGSVITKSENNDIYKNAKVMSKAV